jgi:hypothetical protein
MNLKSAVVFALTLASVGSGQLKKTSYAAGQLAHVPGEPVIVNRFGTYPQKITRGEGPFLLYIQNRLPGHADHYSVTLDQADAPELVGLDTTATKFDASALLNLEPGSYRVQLRERSDLSFAIQITAGTGAAR